MKVTIFAVALLLQAPAVMPLARVHTALRHLSDGFDQHKITYGATPELTDAKRQLRDWIESRMSSLGRDGDTRAFADALHEALRSAGLLCDDCDTNVLGYLDDVRVDRSGGFLVVVTATGISCGYDESAYVYAWDGGWRRVWAHEQDDYAPNVYRPQAIHDLQISAPDAQGTRVLMELASQTICGGAFKNLYARAWRLAPDNRSTRVLDFTAYADDGYPPLLGRVRPGDVLFEYTTDGLASGDPHTAVRHFTIERGAAVQVDPIAIRPHDFVLEWLDAPWADSRLRSASPALAGAHARLQRTDHAGDFADPTLRCADGDHEWQVGTRLYQGPKRYYRVRWRAPFSFTLVAVSEQPFADCTFPDRRGDAYADVLTADLR